MLPTGRKPWLTLFIPILFLTAIAGFYYTKRDVGPYPPLTDNHSNALAVLNNPVILDPVYTGQTRRVEFVLQNTSDKSITIASIGTDCRCTKFVADPAILSAHSQGLISGMIFFDSAPGLIRKGVYVRTEEDGDRLLQIEARIVDSIITVPTILDFGAMYWDEIACKDLRIRCKNGGSIPDTLNVVEGNVRSLHADILGKARNEIRIRVSLNRPSAGSFFQRLLVKSLQSEYAEVAVPIRAEILGPLEVCPSHIYLGSGLPGEIISRRLTCTIKPGAPTHITGVRFRDADVGMEYRITSEGVEHVIDLRFTLPENQGMFADYLVIESEDPEFQRFVGVSAYIDASVE